MQQGASRTATASRRKRRPMRTTCCRKAAGHGAAPMQDAEAYRIAGRRASPRATRRASGSCSTRVRAGAGSHAPAPVHRDHGEVLRRRAQGDPGSSGGGGNMIYLPLDKLLERSRAAPAPASRSRQRARPASEAAADHASTAAAGRALMPRPLPLLVVIAGRRCVLLARMTRVHRCSETELAIRTQFGAIVAHRLRARACTSMPLVDQVREVRTPHHHAGLPGETFLTSENKGLNVDFYVKWRIKDVGRVFPRHRRRAKTPPAAPRRRSSRTASRA